MMTSNYSTRNAYMLLFASQIVNIGFGLLAIFITLLADEINLAPIEIGVIISIFMVARAISSYIIPGLSDNFGRRIILIVSLFIYALSTMLLGFSRDFSSLFMLRIIEGASAGAVFPTAEALLIDSVPKKDRGAWMGKFFTTFNFGFIIGPAVGGLLFTFGTDLLLLDTLTAFIVPFLFTGILGFLSLLSVIFLVEDVIIKPEKEQKLSNTPIKDLQTPHLFPFLGVGLLTGFSIGLIIPIFTLHVTDVFNLDEGTIGFIFTISGSFALLMNYPAGKLSDRTNRLYITIVGMIFAGLGFIGVSLSTTMIVALFFFVLRSMAYQSYLPAYRAFQADKIPSSIRGTVMGRIQSSFNVGAIFGPLIGTWIYETNLGTTPELFGYQFFGGGIPFLVSGIFVIIQVFIILYILTRENNYIEKRKSQQFSIISE